MKPIKVQTTMVIDVELADLWGYDLEVTISGTYHATHKGRHVRGEGQIEPDEDACIDDVCATYDGRTIELTEKQMEEAIEKLMEVVND